VSGADRDALIGKVIAVYRITAVKARNVVFKAFAAIRHCDCALDGNSFTQNDTPSGRDGG